MTNITNDKLQELIKEIAHFAVAVSSAAGTDATQNLVSKCSEMINTLQEKRLSDGY